MTSSLEDRWREISAWLDEALELEPAARAVWLEELARREPAAAARVQAYFDALGKLDDENFLGFPAAYALDASLAGQRFGAYTLEREIGHGGMGTVWLAHRNDGSFEGKAAVKLLNTALVGHPSARRFAREGSVLARLQHPNIAHLLDAGVGAAGQPYLVLEYVRGVSIDRYCADRVLTLEQRIRLFLDVLSAVAHAHSNLIVHRDLKPSNILVTDEGVVKLLDFGVAALLAPTVGMGTQLTRHIAAGLTPAYAAPEQLLGQPITTATDVYALGLVLFVLLAGRHPLGEETTNPADLLRATIDTDMPRPSDVATYTASRQLRGDLDNIISMALRRNPAERYTTADQFAADLRRYLALEPVTARPRSALYLAGMFVRRNRAAVVAVLAIALILAVAMVMTTRQMIEASRQRDRAMFESRMAETTSDFLEYLMFNEDPSVPMRTAYDRLNAGVAVLDRQYRSDPAFQGRMLVELGFGIVSTEDLKRANEIFQQAYDIGRDSNDPELMAVAQCTRAQGDALANVREGVMERIDEADALLAGLATPKPETVAMCALARARVDLRLGHGDAAESSLLRAQKLVEADNGTHREIYTNVLTALGGIYMSRNQPREVLRISQLIGSIHDRNGRGNSFNRLVSRQNAATALSAMGEAGAALAEREVINERLQDIPETKMEPVTLRMNYATLLTRMGQPEKAMELLGPVIERARESGNPALLTNALVSRGTALLVLERWDEADATLQEAESLSAGGIGNRDGIAQLESLRARLELGRGNTAAARQHSDRSLDLAGYHTEKRERMLARVLLVAAKVALVNNTPQDAERFARDSLSISEPNARTPDSSADVGEALLRIGQARLAVGAKGEARPLLERAVRCLANGLSPDHALTAEARAAFAASTQTVAATKRSSALMSSSMFVPDRMRWSAPQIG